MARSTGLLASCLVVAVAAVSMASAGASDEAAVEGSGGLQPVSAFAGFDDPASRSAALFTEASKAILHPRCVNCHPAGEAPLQGEEGRVHEPPVVRGQAGLGATGMMCGACHHDENFDPGGVPGAPHWRLAPTKMAWEGMTAAELCAQLKDPERNGRRSVEEIVEHFADDPLVGWGWAPGEGREPAPGSQEALAELVRAWAESGAVCPE